MKIHNNRAYITAISSNDYINGIVVLYISMRMQQCRYPLYCIVTEDISDENIEVLQKLGIGVLKRNQILPSYPVEFSQVLVDKKNYWHRGMVKLEIFNLTDFDKIVFVDADMIMKSNCDELFDKPHMSACWDGGLNFAEINFSNSFNSGLLVVEPDEELYKDIINFLNNFEDDGIIHDQLVLRNYFSDWPNRDELHLDGWYAPWSSNFNPGYEIYYLYNQSKIKLMHIIDKKPWQVDKQYFINMFNGYPIYTKISLDYIDTLNYTINLLKIMGITSPDLNIIS